MTKGEAPETVEQRHQLQDVDAELDYTHSHDVPPKPEWRHSQLFSES